MSDVDHFKGRKSFQRDVARRISWLRYELQEQLDTLEPIPDSNQRANELESQLDILDRLALEIEQITL